MNLLPDLKMLLLNFNFVMVYIIHKMLILLKNQLNFLKDNIFECLFKEYNRLLLFFKKNIFFTTGLPQTFFNQKSRHDIQFDIIFPDY